MRWQDNRTGLYDCNFLNPFWRDLAGHSSCRFFCRTIDGSLLLLQHLSLSSTVLYTFGETCFWYNLHWLLVSVYSSPIVVLTVRRLLIDGFLYLHCLVLCENRGQGRVRLQLRQTGLNPQCNTDRAKAEPWSRISLYFVCRSYIHFIRCVLYGHFASLIIQCRYILCQLY